MNPLWNSIITAGVSKGQSFLGITDIYGSTYTDNLFATGFGMHLAIPLMRKAWRPDLTKQEAQTLLEDCMRVLFYRDCRALNSIQIGTVTASGIEITPAYSLPTQWEYKRMVNPNDTS